MDRVGVNNFFNMCEISSAKAWEVCSAALQTLRLGFAPLHKTSHAFAARLDTHVFFEKNIQYDIVMTSAFTSKDAFIKN